MDRRNNPFAPGVGLQPPELADRDRLFVLQHGLMDRVGVTVGRERCGIAGLP